MSDSIDREQQEVAPKIEVVKPAAKANSAKKDPAKTADNESAVVSRASAATRGLSKKGVDGLKREAASASSSQRGQIIADKFVARASQRNS